MIGKILEGQVYDVDIEGVGKHGDGLAKIDRFVVFVVGAHAGREYRIRIIKTRPRFAVGEVMSEL